MNKTFSDVTPSTHKIRQCSNPDCDGELFAVVSRLFTDKIGKHIARISGYVCIHCGALYTLEGDDSSMLEYRCYERTYFWPPLNNQLTDGDKQIDC